MVKKYSDVFKPGNYPELTYVSRCSGNYSFTYEERLQQSLTIDGFLTYIVGGSKTGKTVLCEKVIGKSAMISMSGNDFSKDVDFWGCISRKIGLSAQIGIEKRKSSVVLEEQVSTHVSENYFVNKDRVIQYFIEEHKVLVLDDFHYASEEMQYDIACQLKEVIRLGLKAVIISLPHRSDDAIQKNPDLTGRLSVIEIDFWKDHELKQIAEKGFQELEVMVTEPIIERMAMESIHSPQLMQSICLGIGFIKPEAEEITNDMINAACRLVVSNYPYSDVFRVLKAGPPTRGQRRMQYTLNNSTQMDIYSLVLKILKDNPPLIEMSLDELLRRMRGQMGNDKMTSKKIKDTIKNMQKVIAEQKSELYKVFEWKNDTIYILDSLFLFYLRWIEFG